MTRHDPPGPRPVPDGAPVTAGPRWYRARIRTYGPMLGPVPMIVLGAISLTALQLSDGRASGVIGLTAGVAAAPGLLVAGAPLADDSGYLVAVLASAVLWLLLGLIASRRTTRSPMASWRDYWRELSWLTAGVALGAIGALVAATQILGESLIL